MFQNNAHAYGFMSHYYQLESIKYTQPKSLLEIGIGSKIVSNRCKQLYQTVTCDIDGKLEPMIIADIRNLPFADNSYDTVAVFEVIEHVEFKFFERILKDLKNIARQYVVISLPYACASFDLLMRLRLPYFQNISSVGIRISYFMKKIGIESGCKEHHWEIGSRGYSLNKILKIMKKYFIIEECFRTDFDPYHQYFILSIS